MRTLVLLLAVLLAAVPAGADNPPPDEEVAVGSDEFGGSNGFTTPEQFASDRGEFEDVETAATGLGPVFNADSCAACHNTPVTGGSSTTTELRAGRLVMGRFEAHPGGSLIHSRALDPAIQERVFAGFEARELRAATSLLGLGFVECLDEVSLTATAALQPEAMRGEVVMVPVLEAPGVFRVGRFGWKGQHASLISFAADAYVNEMGVTSPLQPAENTSNGRDVSAFDRVADPEDPGGEQGFGKNVEQFARFMRATRPPPRDARVAALPEAAAGEALFSAVGCAACHRPEFLTAPAGTPFNGGRLVVPPALGGKSFRPFSDFLLHDVGTAGGVVQNGPESTGRKFRTPPLWGLRTRPRLMHDALSFTRHEAILRHAGEAAGVTQRYRVLTTVQQRQLQVFLRSL